MIKILRQIFTSEWQQSYASRDVIPVNIPKWLLTYEV